MRERGVPAGDVHRVAAAAPAAVQDHAAAAGAGRVRGPRSRHHPGRGGGRTAGDAAYWLSLAPAAWRDRVEVVAIDMSSIYLSAVRRALPGAQVAVDLFRVVQPAARTAGDVRRRATRELCGRRGRS